MYRKLIKANLVYAVGSAANSAALFLLVPFLVRLLTPEEYGVWALYEVAILLLTILILAGLDIGLMRDYWHLEEEAERRRLTGTILVSLILWGGGVFAAGAGLIASGAIEPVPGAPNSLLWVPGVAWAEATFLLFMSLFRIREKATIFVALSGSRMILFMAGAIGLVQAGYGVVGALVGRFAATILILVVAVALGTRYISLRPDWAGLRRVLRYGLPLLPTNVANYVLFASDRYVLQGVSTLEAVAIYSFAYKIATSFDIMVTRPFAIDWAPRRFKIATFEDAPRRYAEILVLYLLAAVAFVLLIVALTPTIYDLLAPPLYREGMRVVPVILAAYLVYGLSYPLNVGIMLKNRTQYLPLIGWLAAAACLGLNYWWVPRFGMMGAAWATLVSYLLWTGGIAVVSLRLYWVPYDRRVLLFLGLGAIGGYVGLQWIGQQAIAGDVLLVPLFLKIVWLVLIFGGVGTILLRMGRSKPSSQPLVNRDGPA